MRIKRITITGADHTIEPDALIPISQQFRRVEWGILFSDKHQGRTRYPVPEWIDDFARIARIKRLKASAHLCNGYVSDLIQHGDFSWLHRHKRLREVFQRVQLNFHGKVYNPHPDFFAILKKSGFQFIFQTDKNNLPLLYRARSLGVNAVPLFDASGGRGIVPTLWPQALPSIYVSYAGGITPENMPDVLPDIGRAAVGAREIGIDTETGTRKPENDHADLNRYYAIASQTPDFVPF